MSVPWHGTWKFGRHLVWPALVLMTLIVFWQVREFDFVNLDDDLYVTSNPHVKSGVSLEDIIWAFTTTDYAAFWQPLTWLSLMLDAELFGDDAGGFHLTNLFFHTVNVLLLFAWLWQMTGDYWKSAAVASFFAVHPLHVESVAWVTERKDVLSTFFGLLALLAYVRAVRKRKFDSYALAWAGLLCSLMSKQMLVTFPFLLLLLDCWPLGRLGVGWNEPTYAALSFASSQRVTGATAALRSATWSRLLIEKLPFFVLTLVFCVIAYMAQQQYGVVMPSDHISFIARISNAIIVYVVYLGQTLWPADLTVFYPHPVKEFSVWQVVAAALLLSIISVVAIWQRTRRPWLLFGWLWYLGSLVPVIGLVQVGHQQMADRFTYVPHIGLLIAVVWTVPTLLPRGVSRHVLLPSATVIAVLLLMRVSWVQTGYWRNSVTLFEHNLRVAAPSFLAHSNLGMALLRINRPHSARLHFEQALQLSPHEPQAHSNMGLIMYQQGDIDAAISHFQRALKLNPELQQALINMGNALCEKGHLERGIRYLEQARRGNPGNAMTHSNLGLALAGLGRRDEAIKAFRTAIRIDRHFVPALFNLGSLYLNNGKQELAKSLFEQVLRVRASHAGAHNNLGVVLVHQGERSRAIDHFREAVRLQPNYADARENLHRALNEQD